MRAAPFVGADQMRESQVESLCAIVTAQSALIFGLVSVLSDMRVPSRAEIRAVF